MLSLIRVCAHYVAAQPPHATTLHVRACHVSLRVIDTHAQLRDGHVQQRQSVAAKGRGKVFCSEMT